MRHILVLFLCIILTRVHAQVPEGYRLTEPLSASAQKLTRAKNVHSGIYPFAPFIDTLEIQSTRDSIFNRRQGIQFRFEPLADLNGGISMYPTFGNATFGSAGLGITTTFGDRFFIRGDYQAGWQYFPDYLQQFTHERYVLAGQGEACGTGTAQFAHVWTATAGLRMGNHFMLEAGRDKHFWGDGYRSMILSHNAAPYNYARLTTRIWRIKYVNLWTMMRDIATGQDRTKFMAHHALSWNVTSRFNLSLFETVIWQEKDSLSQRGFEPSYLNPLIFYRPVEFAQGSGDNVLLGLSAKVELDHDVTLYSQLYLDEFLIDELRRRRGWWANKFAIQVGAKAYDVAGKNINLLTEVNVVRPFTYTHGSVVQSYGHLNQSLAHPLGTNFFEWVSKFEKVHQQMTYRADLILAYYGKDKDGLNYGADVFTSYRNPSSLFENTIGQGRKNNLYLLRTGADRTLGTKYPVTIGAELGLRYLHNQLDNPVDGWFMINLRTPLVRPYRDF